jgi:hypothetical protein
VNVIIDPPVKGCFLRIHGDNIFSVPVRQIAAYQADMHITWGYFYLSSFWKGGRLRVALWVLTIANNFSASSPPAIFGVTATSGLAGAGVAVGVEVGPPAGGGLGLAVGIGVLVGVAEGSGVGVLLAGTGWSIFDASASLGGKLGSKGKAAEGGAEIRLKSSVVDCCSAGEVRALEKNKPSILGNSVTVQSSSAKVGLAGSKKSPRPNTIPAKIVTFEFTIKKVNLLYLL